MGRTPLTVGICEGIWQGPVRSVEAGWRLSRRGRIITMADRYQDRPFPADDRLRSRRRSACVCATAESDPLAELARLIGQTDPFGTMGRANRGPSRAISQPTITSTTPAGRTAAPAGRRHGCSAPTGRKPPQQDYQPSAGASAAPLCRAAGGARAGLSRPAPPFADAEHEPDPSRYDDALYGQLDSRPAAIRSTTRPMPTIAYAYQDTAMATAPRSSAPKRRGGLITVAAVLALAVVGTGGAFAYRTYVGSPRSGEPPIIKADAGPTKIVPAPADGTASCRTVWRRATATEKIVPREEAPVDVNAKSGPRVVFPPLNQNANPPLGRKRGAGAPPPTTAGNGTLPNSEPRKIKTFSVRGDQPDGAASAGCIRCQPAAAEHGVPRGTLRPPARAAAASASGNAPLSLAPQASGRPPAEPRDPGRRDHAGAGRSPQRRRRYLVQVSSQRNEADAQASFRALQGKFPAVLGSRSAGHQARRSRRQGRLLPRHGRSVRLARRGLPVLRQPEDRRRPVRRPKELTAVSLTPGLPAG